MAKIFRISGYLVSEDKLENAGEVKKWFESTADYYEMWQQLHVEESEEFEIDGEDKENCDLALLTRHFKKNIPTEYDRPLPKTGEKYRHFKIGKIVTVIDIARHTETEEVLVAYVYEKQLWVRPLEMFMSKVDREKYPAAEQKYRFELVESCTGATGQCSAGRR